MTGFNHQHLVAGGERVDDGGLPGARAAGGKNKDLAATGIENRFHPFKAFTTQMGELLPPVVNSRPINGSKDSIRHIRWAWDLEKVPACLVGRMGMGHWWGSGQCQWSVSGRLGQGRRFSKFSNVMRYEEGCDGSNFFLRGGIRAGSDQWRQFGPRMRRLKLRGQTTQKAIPASRRNELS